MWPSKAFTIGIIFPRSPKVYEFATPIKCKVGDLVVVHSKYSPPQTLSVVSIVEGIKPHVTKWRSGGFVTQEQRNQLGIKEEKVMVSKLPVKEVQNALEVIRKLQRDIGKKGEDSFVDVKPQLSVSKVGDFIVSGVSYNTLPQKVTLKSEVEKLVNFVYEDDAKSQARERLAALEKEAAEIRQLLS